MHDQWMIYGAYGYSGELIAREAAARGMNPILAGRNESKLRALANELKLGFRVIDLADGAALRRELEDMDLVLHCAGPFSATHRPMVNACIESNAHYFDITGEIDVFEQAHDPAVGTRSRQAGVIVCPGVGFDVVPTDCLAAKLKEALPSATSLVLAFQGGRQMSPGTAKTTIESMSGLSKVREKGRIVDTPVRTRSIDFGQGARNAMCIPWGDVSTAYHSTGIGNVEVYIPASPKTVKRVRRMQRLRWLMSRGWVQSWLKSRVGKKVKGPSAESRAQSTTVLWGEVEDAEGNRRSARFETPNGYDLTITAPLEIVRATLAAETSKTGSLTPSQLMGADFVWRLPGVTQIEWLEWA